LIWYWINRNIGLSSIGLNEMYCIALVIIIEDLNPLLIL
jgi:hypothetical protein